VSKRMEAQWTILTHFSQRYPKMSLEILKAAEVKTENGGVNGSEKVQVEEEVKKKAEFLGKARNSSNGNSGNIKRSGLNDKETWTTFGVAFDLMSVSLKDIWRLNHLIPALGVLYPPKGIGVDIEPEE
jgi:hypothetical protein